MPSRSPAQDSRYVAGGDAHSTSTDCPKANSRKDDTPGLVVDGMRLPAARPEVWLEEVMTTGQLEGQLMKHTPC